MSPDDHADFLELDADLAELLDLRAELITKPWDPAATVLLPELERRCEWLLAEMERVACA